MSHKYTDIFFTDTVKQVQVEQRSRSNYASMELGDDVNYLFSPREADFIANRDSVYMASVTETGWPYVQHRGGPTGFMKVIDEKTIGFADFSGNSQYVSTGNFRTNNRVSLFFMDYPNRTRLKVAGRVSVVSDSDWETLAKLEVPEYRARVERGFIIHVEGFDWNCPQHITPRFTEGDLQKLLTPLMEENQSLKARLTDSAQPQAAQQLGHGELPLVITGIRQLADQIRAYELRSPDGKNLPEIQPGAHLKVPVKLENGREELRHYSICSNPTRRDIYEIAVRHEPDGRGGSSAIHKHYRLGLRLNCEPPENYFQLHNDQRPAVLIAGGIGITPLKPMAQMLKAKGIDFTLHYSGRDQSSMAFYDRIKREFADRLHLYHAETPERLSLDELLANAAPSTVFYACGPARLIDDLIATAKRHGIDDNRIRFERFSAAPPAQAQPITVTLARSGQRIQVADDQSILDALLDSDIPVPYSCKTGQCKSCVVKVVDGEPLHNDDALSDTEKHTGQLMCPCVSRAKTDYLTLDL